MKKSSTRRRCSCFSLNGSRVMPHFWTKKNLRFVFFPCAKCIEVLIQYFLPQYTVQLQIWLIVVQISIGHILLLLNALFKCWTCSGPCWICKKIFGTRCLAYDQPNELFFYINIFTLISYSPKPLCQMKLKKILIFIGRSHKNIRIRKLFWFGT